MKLRSMLALVAGASALVGALMMGGAIQAADSAPTIRFSKSTFNPDDATIEMFNGIDDGSLEVKLIPKNSKEARIFIKNKTDKPVNVKLPDAFVGVLQQGGGLFGGGGGGVGGQGGQGGGGQQSFGGGGGGFGGQGGGGGGLGGFGNIPPDRVGEFRVACVCLEHGKDEPKATVAYVIKPVETFSSDPALKELLTLYGQGEISQPVAQVVAWHIADKMSFQELAAKEIRRLNGQRYSYFSRDEINAAMRLMGVVQARVKEKAKEKPAASPGELSKAN
jgi:hypothetical protein